jgi:hypothetical protein
MPVWYAAPLVVKEETHFREEGTIGLYGHSVE